jgi:hypothetical protein
MPTVDNVKDSVQIVLWVVTISTLIVAALKGRAELRENRAQRDRDLRWRQAQAGKELNDEMQMDSRAWPAMQMLDSTSRAYTLSDGVTFTIDENDIRRALDPNRFLETPKDSYIRDCFDTLFYFMAMIHHYVQNSLILKDDVAYPLEYYVPLLGQFRAEISAYTKKHDLGRTRRYLTEFHDWKFERD